MIEIKVKGVPFRLNMKSLEAQRALYLKTVEAAGSVEVMEVVQKLETKAAKLSAQDCKHSLSDVYIRTGAFPTYSPYWCQTQEVHCFEKDQARVKEYFEERNPNFFVSTFPPGHCTAHLRTEPLFEEKK